MIGDGNHHHGMMVQVPPWTTLIDDNNPAAGISPFSPRSPNAIASSIEDYAYFLRSDAALRRYLEEDLDDGAGSGGCTDFDITSEAYACDAFRMYEFKVRKCARGRSHDWTDCPYAHPGEKARRRDPRKYSYSGTACPEFRKGSCKKGDGCEFAHGVFECWLHPHRYRTQPCKDGGGCRRRVCFFAHAPEQLRVVSPHGGAAAAEPSSYDGSASSASAPDSPTMDGQALSRSLGSVTVSDMLTSLRRLQLNSKAPNMGATWNVQMGRSLASPRSGFYSLPSTPTRPVTRAVGYSGIWEDLEEEEPAMERVESGRDLRARMFEKLSKENGVDGPGEGPNPDVGWISELVK